MNIPLNPDKKDPIWTLFSKVLKHIDSRSFQQELARNSVKPIKKFQKMLKIILLASYFELNISDVVKQVEDKPKLRKFLNLVNPLTLKQVYEINSRHDESKYLEIALKTINKLQFKPIRGSKRLIVDSTDLKIDLKHNGKYLSKQTLLYKDYKRAYSSSKGHYAGFKLTLVLEYRTTKVLAVLIHPGSPHDSKIFDEILNELKRRRLVKKWKEILFDRGYYSAKNYLIGINKYKIVPVIFPKKVPTIKKLMDKLENPLDYFDENNLFRSDYPAIRKRVEELLVKWEDLRSERWKIEEFFKLIKGKLSLDCVHAYTRKSVYKNAYLNVLLAGMVISFSEDDIGFITMLIER
ncbi:MAG: transposase [Methanobacteriaceae archaeon]